ncbi:MAG: hypothetical protein ACE15F_15115 [bacterium]
MKETVLKAGRITLGILLLLIGAISGLIPFIQGWIFGLAGLWLLSKDVPFVRRYYEKMTAWVEEKKKERRERTRSQSGGATPPPGPAKEGAVTGTVPPPPPPPSKKNNPQ